MEPTKSRECRGQTTDSGGLRLGPTPTSYQTLRSRTARARRSSTTAARSVGGPTRRSRTGLRLPWRQLRHPPWLGPMILGFLAMTGVQRLEATRQVAHRPRQQNSQCSLALAPSTRLIKAAHNLRMHRRTKMQSWRRRRASRRGRHLRLTWWTRLFRWLVLKARSGYLHSVAAHQQVSSVAPQVLEGRPQGLVVRQTPRTAALQPGKTKLGRRHDVGIPKSKAKPHQERRRAAQLVPRRRSRQLLEQEEVKRRRPRWTRLLAAMAIRPRECPLAPSECKASRPCNIREREAEMATSRAERRLPQQVVVLHNRP